MNEHDELADEIRARTESLHVEAPSPAQAMSRGRRRLRISRAVAAVAALVIALGVALPLRALMPLGQPPEPLDPPPSVSADIPAGTIAFIDGGQGSGSISLIDVTTGAARPLTTQSYSSVSLAWSPDGSLIAVTDHLGEGSSELVLVSTETGKATRMPIDPELSPQDVDWSPDGELLAFTDSLARLHTIRADGSDLQPVQTDGRAINISFAPSGNQIAFVGDKGDLNIVDLQTGATRVVYADAPGQRVWFGPTWSPDGSQLAFSIFEEGGSSINIVNADGSDFRSLVDPSREGTNPSWSPDGNWISFVGGEGQRDLYAVAVEDGTIRQLTDTPSDEVGSDWGRLPADTSSNADTPSPDCTYLDPSCPDHTFLVGLLERADFTMAGDTGSALLAEKGPLLVTAWIPSGELLPPSAEPNELISGTLVTRYDEDTIYWSTPSGRQVVIGVQTRNGRLDHQTVVDLVEASQAG